MIIPAELQYKLWRQSLSMKQIESYCRQILAHCDAEYIAEQKRLKEEARNFPVKRFSPKIEEPDSPGYIVDETP